MSSEGIKPRHRLTGGGKSTRWTKNWNWYEARSLNSGYWYRMTGSKMAVNIGQAGSKVPRIWPTTTPYFEILRKYPLLLILVIMIPFVVSWCRSIYRITSSEGFFTIPRVFAPFENHPMCLDLFGTQDQWIEASLPCEATYQSHSPAVLCSTSASAY